MSSHEGPDAIQKAADEISSYLISLPRYVSFAEIIKHLDNASDAVTLGVEELKAQRLKRAVEQYAIGYKEALNPVQPGYKLCSNTACPHL